PERFDHDDLAHWQFFDLTEWKFYVVPRRWLEERLGEKKKTSLSPSTLEAEEFGPLSWEELETAVHQFAQGLHRG
ncbi:MAG: hypothetical protein WBD55_02665, partial [Dehalococcoidia bacterium]